MVKNSFSEIRSVVRRCVQYGLSESNSRPLIRQSWFCGQAPIFIVLNAAPEAIAFKLPKMAEYNSWQRLLNTADSDQTAADFASGADLEAPPRSVLAFAGSA